MADHFRTRSKKHFRELHYRIFAEIISDDFMDGLRPGQSVYGQVCQVPTPDHGPDPIPGYFAYLQWDPYWQPKFYRLRTWIFNVQAKLHRFRYNHGICVYKCQICHTSYCVADIFNEDTGSWDKLKCKDYPYED